MTTEAELYGALQAAISENVPDRPDGYRTVEELAQQTEQPRARIYAGLRQLKKQGRLQSTKIHQENIAGTMQPVPAYRLAVDG